MNRKKLIPKKVFDHNGKLLPELDEYRRKLHSWDEEMDKLEKEDKKF